MNIITTDLHKQIKERKRTTKVKNVTRACKEKLYEMTLSEIKQK